MGGGKSITGIFMKHFESGFCDSYACEEFSLLRFIISSSREQCLSITNFNCFKFFKYSSFSSPNWASLSSSCCRRMNKAISSNSSRCSGVSSKTTFTLLRSLLMSPNPFARVLKMSWLKNSPD